MTLDMDKVDQESKLRSPQDFIRDYYPLQGAVDPLVELLKNTPSLTKPIIELAMMMGIQAARNKYGSDEIDERLADRLRQIDEKMRDTYPFWANLR